MAIATDRLARLQDGRLELRLKRPWRDGTIAFRYTPHELLERLVALVPRPRRHLTRYHGGPGPRLRWQVEIVRPPCGLRPPPDRPPAPAGAQPPERPGRWPWASLIWRVFLKDALVCARCRGRMAIVAAVTATENLTRILKHLGLPDEAPTFHAARPPPQPELAFDVAPAFEPDPPARED